MNGNNLYQIYSAYLLFLLLTLTILMTCLRLSLTCEHPEQEANLWILQRPDDQPVLVALMDDGDIPPPNHPLVRREVHRLRKAYRGDKEKREYNKKFSHVLYVGVYLFC